MVPVASDDGDYHCLADDNGTLQEKVLQWMDGSGNAYSYLPNPLTQVCSFILLQEMCERLAYYGLMPTLMPFLKRFLGLSDSAASAYMGWFQGIIFLTPLLSAVLADTFLGVFRTILIFSGFYMAGLLLVCLAAIEGISQPWMVHLGLMGFMTLGSGGIKSCVNVFGAQQFHEVEHKEQMTSYFTYFYASINIGALIGGIVCPLVQESVSFFVAYLIPLVSFLIATTIFVSGSSRYVRILPQGSPLLKMVQVLLTGVRQCSLESSKKSNGGTYEDRFVDDTKAVLRLIPIFLLVVPLLIAYNQMSTAFLIQGHKMHSTFFGARMAPALMQSVDSVAVIMASCIVDRWLYPTLRQSNRMPSVLTRFVFGNVLGAFSVMCAFCVERTVMAQPLYTVSIWSQVPQFVCIAFAEIFLISTSYEVAFTNAPDSLKAVASAFNLLFFSVAGFVSGLLFVACEKWMPDFDPKKASTYQDSRYDLYYLVLAGICCVGAVGSFLLRPYYDRVALRGAEMA